MSTNLVHFRNVETNMPDQDDIAWRKRQIKEHFFKFEGEKYAEENKGVFIQLKERSNNLGLV